jgi:enolase
MTSPTAIAALHARRVWDSRGRPTVEAEVTLAGGATGRAIAPAGASRGSAEAIDLRDGGAAFGGMGVGRALAAVADTLAPGLAGLDAADHAAVDARIATLDGTPHKARLGGNATIAVSMAVAHAAAAARGLPLWRALAGDAPVRLPMPMIQIFGGGAHAGRRIDIQDVLVMPVGARCFDEAMAMTAEVYRAAGVLMTEAGRIAGVADEGGWWPDFATSEEAIERTLRAIERAGLRPGIDAALALDVAASEFGRDGRYTLAAEKRTLDTAGMIDLVAGWCDAYPIVSVEDPLAEDDAAGMAAITARIGRAVQVVGDDFLVTDAARVRAAAAAGACNAVLVKPNQIGTLTEAKAALDAARAAGWRSVVSARSGESEDVTIVHLAVGWGAPQLKVGSFARSERMAKWNEAIRIEDALGAAAAFAGRTAVGGSGMPLA